MSVDCWSAHIPDERDVERLHRIPSSSEYELITLDSGKYPIPLASKLLVWGKVTYLTGTVEDPEPSDPPFFLVITTLHDSRLQEPVDVSYSNLNLRYPGATTVCVHAAIDAPADHLGAGHRLSMRTDYTGRPVRVQSVWLSAIELKTVHMEP